MESIISRFTLSADLIDLLFMSLPDFESLYSALRTSKAFFDVFEAHPQSIVRAIAYNQVGPSLPQALRLIRCESGQYETDTFLEGDVMTPHITPEEARKLASNTRVVRCLENLFSWRHKDRTSQISQLSFKESLRFHRALYRLWLFSSTFGGDQIVDEADDMEILQVHQARKDFLDVIETPELLELERVVSFLNETSMWSARADGLFTNNNAEWYAQWALTKGPPHIFNCYKDCSTSYVLDSDIDLDYDNPLVEDFVSGSLSRIWEERKVNPPTGDYSQAKIILDEVAGENDKCRSCGAVEGLKLWNETNWRLLRGFITPGDVKMLFKGELPKNAFEIGPLIRDLLNGTMSYQDMMQEIFDFGPSVHSSKEDWICLDCIKHILREHLHLWWLDHSLSGGATVREDCWWGFNCRTMTHKITHAMKLNHLCEQTRSGKS